MKSDPRIRSAIDESLSSVHFDARDMHAVLRAARCQEPPGGKPGGLCFLLGGDHMSALELHMEGENLPMLFR